MHELLTAWFGRNGRDLPWRKTRDPYAILVSEVMLQQTQVERVIPRYLRWLERSGGEFGPELAGALMDLGATVCLARIPRCGACPLEAECPSRGRRYEPARKQGPFEGSFRQRRALALRAVADGLEPADEEAVASLARDGLVSVVDGSATLPA